MRMPSGCNSNNNGKKAMYIYQNMSTTASKLVAFGKRVGAL